MDLLTPELFLKLGMSQGYTQNFEKNCKSSICIRVNNFDKSVNFQISRESSQKNIENYQNLNNTPYMGKLTVV